MIIKITDTFIVERQKDDTFQVLFAKSATISSDDHLTEVYDIVTNKGNYGRRIYADMTFPAIEVDALVKYMQGDCIIEHFSDIATIRISKPKFGAEKIRKNLMQLALKK